MKTFYLRTPQAFLPGDPLLESDRLATRSIRPLSDPAQAKDDLPALRDVLLFLKLPSEDIKTIMKGAQDIVKIVGGIVSVVGAVTSVVDLMNKLEVFGPQQDATQAALKEISRQLTSIYDYLKEEEIKGLHMEAVGWRSVQTKARNSLRNAQLAPTPSILKTLVDRIADLDTALDKMLAPESGNIAFLPTVYKYVPDQFHWIDAALPPFMSQADGKPINLTPSQELGGRIWDPGHYIDVLFASLAERMLTVVTVEPAFRSTGYDRTQLKSLVDKLTIFINTWRGAMLVASPSAGLSGGVPILLEGPAKPIPGSGILQNPFQPFASVYGTRSAPSGIVLGAVDSVTGIVAWEPFFQGFDRLGEVSLTNYGPFEGAWGGTYDVFRAKDPAQALAAAEERQAEYLDRVVVASGIGELVKLRAQLQLAALGVSGSEFVDLPNAHFRLVKKGINIDGSPAFAIRRGGAESVDLGALSTFAEDPAKRYNGMRYFQETEKTFRFRMALRTRQTKIQLGYRLRIGNTDIPLVPFSEGAFLDGNLPAFPTDTIKKEVHEIAQVYNVRQSHVFSFAEEDLFEAGEPIPSVNSPWAIRKWRGRLFLDERPGKVALAVEVRFEHDATGQHYAAEAIVTIRNLDPEQFPDAVIIPVRVYETHMDHNDTPRPQEVVADSMTIHVVPSFLVMGQDYFAAHWETVAFMEKTIDKLNDRFGRQERMPRPPSPDPAWAVRRQVLNTIALVDEIDARRSKQPEVVAEVIQQFRPPAVRH